MIRFTAIAPTLLKNMANPFGKTMRQMVEKTDVMTANVFQTLSSKNKSLKLRAVEIPHIAEIKNNTKQIILFIRSPWLLNNHEMAGLALLIFSPIEAATP